MKSFVLAVLLVLAALSTVAQTLPPAIAAPDPLQILGAPKGTPLSGEALRAETGRVSALLRCPVCQGLSIDDSPSPMAVNMKRQVSELLAKGYQRDQILRYFETSYGEFVRLEPARRGVNWIVWLAPLAILLFGFAIIGRILRRSREIPSPVPADVDDPYLERVRAMTSTEAQRKEERLT